MRWTAVVLGLLVARQADACSVCGCGDPMVDASESIPAMSTLRLALDAEWLQASAASDDDSGATESVTQWTVRPAIVYSPVRSLNFVAEIPFEHKDWSMKGWPSSSLTGIGDVDVGARWFAVSHIDWAARSRQDFGLSVGTSLPTGPDDAMVTGTGIRLDDHAQLGTGAFGPYAGLVYAFHRDPWNLFASVTARAHTTSSFDYRYGTSVAWTVRGDLRVAEPLAFELGLDGRQAWRDESAGMSEANTGGLVLAASPGVVWSPVNRLWLRARVQLPFYTHLYGEQTVGPTVLVSAQVMVR